MAGPERKGEAVILTQGEKMVWAATFVHSAFDQDSAMPDQERADKAAVAGQAAVKLMRIAKCPDGEENCTTTQMLRAMLGDEG